MIIVISFRFLQEAVDEQTSQNRWNIFSSLETWKCRQKMRTNSNEIRKYVLFLCVVFNTLFMVSLGGYLKVTWQVSRVRRGPCQCRCQSKQKLLLMAKSMPMLMPMPRFGIGVGQKSHLHIAVLEKSFLVCKQVCS